MQLGFSSKMFAMSLFLQSVAWAAPLTFELETNSDNSVEFKAPSARLFPVTGKGTSPMGNIQVDGTKVSGTATFDLKSLDAGVRTKHMREKYLEVEKFPTSTLVISKMDLPKALSELKDSWQDIPFEGDLTLHGVKAKQLGKATITKSSSGYAVLATFQVKLKDFQVPTPIYEEVTVGNEINLTIKTSVPAK